MFARSIRAVALSSVLVFALAGVSSGAAAPKVGGTCTKLGATSKGLICTRSPKNRKLLVWAAAPKATTTTVTLRAGGTFHLTGTFPVRSKAGSCAAQGTTEIPYQMDADGTLPGLGAMKLHVDETAVCGAPGSLDSVKDVSGWYDAANGERLQFAGPGGKIVFDQVKRTATYDTLETITGGTGRFAGATGTNHSVVVLTFADMKEQITVTVDVTLAAATVTTVQPS
jgi:hypothetical protein